MFLTGFMEEQSHPDREMAAFGEKISCGAEEGPLPEALARYQMKDGSSMAEGQNGKGELLSDLLREWLAQGELTTELGGRLWKVLEAVVVSELKRRGLWSSSPRYLGFVGHTWQEPGTRGSGPLADLLSEVFLTAIAQPLPRWRILLADPAAQLEAALVKAIRHAVHAIHQRHDRLGYALYQRAKEALSAALDAGELHLVGSPESKIGNASVITARPTTSDRNEVEPAPPEALAAQVPLWLDELLPELVTAVKQTRQNVVTQLRQNLVGLAAAGIETWRFKDLMDPLKAQVRALWQHRGKDDQGDLLQEVKEDGLHELVRIVQPHQPQRLELEHLERLLECLAEQIDRHPTQERTREHFWSLWGYLGTHVDPASDEDRLPSARELERLLKIPREKIPVLLEGLGRFLELCQKLLSRLVKGPSFARGGSK